MKVDMSPHAITMRLKKTSELRRLCISLGGERLRKKLSYQTGQQKASDNKNSKK